MFKEAHIRILKMAQTGPILKRQGKYFIGLYQVRTRFVDDLVTVGYLERLKDRIVITNEGNLRIQND